MTKQRNQENILHINHVKYVVIERSCYRYLREPSKTRVFCISALENHEQAHDKHLVKHVKYERPCCETYVFYEICSIEYMKMT